jgi:cyclopropane fatty-acyl-phospholipid synthase-like methyltransferase
MFDISLYNDEFFFWHLKYARLYSIETMDWYILRYKPNSVIDFGCGIGSYLESCYNNGLTNIKGYDIGGDYASKYTPNFLKQYISYQDCTLPIVEKKYDCVISFETAEHIDPIGTDTFVKNISDAVTKSGKILFTAAPPGQDGCGHINLHPKEFWLDKFSQHSKVQNVEITEEVKRNWKNIAPNYIIENLIVLENV